jgi:hypothetical protein
MNWTGCGRKSSLRNLRYFPSICLEGLRKAQFEPGKFRIRNREVFTWPPCSVGRRLAYITTCHSWLVCDGKLFLLHRHTNCCQKKLSKDVFGPLVESMCDKEFFVLRRTFLVYSTGASQELIRKYGCFNWDISKFNFVCIRLQFLQTQKW